MKQAPLWNQYDRLVSGRKGGTDTEDEAVRIETAVYLGVVNYGAAQTNRENMDQFRYRFLICDTDPSSWRMTENDLQGEEERFKIDNGAKDAKGNYDYPIQNVLKEGYAYRIRIDEGAVTQAEELPVCGRAEFTPVVSGTPGVHTLTNFLKTALEPVGTTLYIFGGGWDWQDTGTAVQGRTLGVSPDWVRFFREQDADFTFKDRDDREENRDPSSSYYPFGRYNAYYYAGLDCSGYVGWALYNTLEDENGKDGYVCPAGKMAGKTADRGYGTWTHRVQLPDKEHGVRPGDLVSMDGHIWISLGTCEDGSVVILHSTPSRSRTGQPGGGVQISAVGADENCEAMQLADRYMSEYYPEWYARYPAVLRAPENYFSFKDENTGLFSWTTDREEIFTDPDGLQEMRPAQVLEILFANTAG